MDDEAVDAARTAGHRRRRRGGGRGRADRVLVGGRPRTAVGQEEDDADEQDDRDGDDHAPGEASTPAGIRGPTGCITPATVVSRQRQFPGSNAEGGSLDGHRRNTGAQPDGSRVPPVGLGPSPLKRLALVMCMDCRVDAHVAFRLNPGEVHLMRNAGGVVTDDVIRSLSISQHALGTREVMIVHHTDCGLAKLQEDEFRDQLAQFRRVPADLVGAGVQGSARLGARIACAGSGIRRSCITPTRSAASSSTSRPACWRRSSYASRRPGSSSPDAPGSQDAAGAAMRAWP